MDGRKELINAKGISKRFGVVEALKNVDFVIHSGEILGLAGHNGAGKSVFLKTICGIHKPDSGVIEYEGTAKTFSDIREAQEWGLYMVPQELTLATGLTVMENVFIGRREFSQKGLVNRKYIISETKRLFKEFFNLEIDPTAEVGKLDSVTQRIVQVVRCLQDGAKVVVFDETTAGLARHEKEILFGHFKALAEKGLGIIFVTHMLDEIFQVCEHVVVFRAGEKVGAYDIEELSEKKLIECIVGEKTERANFEKTQRSEEVVLSVSNARTINGSVSNVSFDLHKGEIIGIYGLQNQGQTLLLDSLYGIYEYARKDIAIAGHSLHIKRPVTAVKNGFSFLPERGVKTNFDDKTILENLLVQYSRFQDRHMMIDRGRERREGEEQVGKFGVKGYASLEQRLDSLSGGNRQKVLIARTLLNHPKVMMLIEPTQGIDIGAKTEVKRLLLQAASEGCGIIIVTAEIDDIIEICNRVLVIRNGKIIDTLDATEENRLDIIYKCSGFSDQ